ncbi:transposase [uncultured Acetobacteroides sp.]|uniref:transposase n=1 Tax=uncultured Acetobacteroides sp. TaxID=1760811 RepID=UPI0029F59814|nr:transposase [uncultured Acetobacteroides sp.]
MTLYKNQYRIETTRLQNWDYTTYGAYFITICTYNRENLFGHITNGEMHLNLNGNIVEQCWHDLPNHYPNLILDAFVIMPDHIHCIIMINNNSDGGDNGNDGIDGGNGIVQTGFKPVSPGMQETGLKPVSTKSHGIFEFVRALKTFSSRQINKINDTPGTPRWQTRFYDRIIRDEPELQQIRQYIHDNPAKWEK